MKKILIISIAALLFTACGIYKPYFRPQVQAKGLYGIDYETSDTTSLASLSWRELFTDIHLQSLIEKALQQNTNMQSAILLIDEAKATLNAARLAFLPSFAFSPQGNISKFDGDKAVQAYQLPLTASWQIDVFGNLHNTKKQAKALYTQSQDYAQAVQSQLIANVANIYYTLLMIDRQLEIAEATEQSWQESLKSRRVLKHAGLSTEAAVSQTEAICQSVAVGILDLKEQLIQTENSLCLLLAEIPHKIERGRLEEQHLTSSIKTGVSIQLLINRPDVRMSEHTLEKAFYATNIARSAFYPNITLSGSAGWTNTVGEMIVNPGKFLAAAIGSLIQPLFANGRLKAQLKIAKSTQERAVLNFQQSLLNAGTEVNNALTQLQTTSSKSKLYERQIHSLQAAVDNTKLLMYHGNITYLEILTAQQSLYDAQINQTANQIHELQAVVNLYQALGGGK